MQVRSEREQGAELDALFETDGNLRERHTVRERGRESEEKRQKGEKEKEKDRRREGNREKLLNVRRTRGNAPPRPRELIPRLLRCVAGGLRKAVVSFSFEKNSPRFRNRKEYRPNPGERCTSFSVWKNLHNLRRSPLLSVPQSRFFSFRIR